MPLILINMKKVCLILLISLLFYSCKKDNSSTTTGSNSTNAQFTANEKKLALNDNAFGIEFFKQIYGSIPKDSNIMVSPLSVSLALGMTYNGSNGSTKTAMQQALMLTGMSDNDINTSYKGLIDKLTSLDTNVKFSIANSIWYRNTFNVQQSFISTDKTYFYADVTAMDFNQSNASQIINDWVAEKTNNKIKSIINEIDPTTVMFLIDAIYFKGAWKYTFDSKYTALTTFNINSNSTKQVQMMKQRGKYKTYNDGTLYALELPYGKEQFSMILILPCNNNTINDIIPNLSADEWNNIVSNLKQSDTINVEIPKFKFDFSQTLNQVLAQMGMGIAFTDNADFTRINPNGNLQISKVTHKTYIDVNEKGTEAAAVTVVEIVNTSAPITDFIANQPFLFAIKEVQTNAIIFIGRVSNPVGY